MTLAAQLMTLAAQFSMAPVAPSFKDHAYYLAPGFQRDTTSLVSRAGEVLKDVHFDTIVCTGLSGMLVAPILWRALDVPHFAVVRKEEDQSNHSSRAVEGTIGSLWLFVDDLVYSGRTEKRVREVVQSRTNEYGHPTAFVGTYTYERGKYRAGGYGELW